jgi:hypothetical protein
MSEAASSIRRDSMLRPPFFAEILEAAGAERCGILFSDCRFRGQGVEGGRELPATMIEARGKTSRDKFAVNKVSAR